jgi:hypothetical protein
MTIPRILKSEEDKAIEEYERKWSTLDAALYRSVASTRRASPADVFAKVFIIGRTYQTGIASGEDHRRAR